MELPLVHRMLRVYGKIALGVGGVIGVGTAYTMVHGTWIDDRRCVGHSPVRVRVTDGVEVTKAALTTAIGIPVTAAARGFVYGAAWPATVPYLLLRCALNDPVYVNYPGGAAFGVDYLNMHGLAAPLFFSGVYEMRLRYDNDEMYCKAVPPATLLERVVGIKRSRMMYGGGTVGWNDHPFRAFAPPSAVKGWVTQ